jgi:hypothetical protein
MQLLAKGFVHIKYAKELDALVCFDFISALVVLRKRIHLSFYTLFHFFFFF